MTPDLKVILKIIMICVTTALMVSKKDQWATFILIAWMALHY